MKVLVTTASKHGSTDEIGARIGAVLGARGHRVELLRVADVRDLEPFDVIVLGSAVYAGHWERDARELVQRQHDAFASRPVWLFSSGPVGDPPKPLDDPLDIDTLLASTHALGHHVFAGKIDHDALSMPERAIVNALRVGEGDFRDWTDVESWASSIADAISTG